MTGISGYSREECLVAGLRTLFHAFHQFYRKGHPEQTGNKIVEPDPQDTGCNIFCRVMVSR